VTCAGQLARPKKDRCQKAEELAREHQLPGSYATKVVLKPPRRSRERETRRPDRAIVNGRTPGKTRRPSKSPLDLGNIEAGGVPEERARRSACPDDGTRPPLVDRCRAVSSESGGVATPRAGPNGRAGDPRCCFVRQEAYSTRFKRSATHDPPRAKRKLPETPQVLPQAPGHPVRWPMTPLRATGGDDGERAKCRSFRATEREKTSSRGQKLRH